MRSVSHAIFAAVLLVATGPAAVAADALPTLGVDRVAAPPVVLVRGGCGIGFYRDAYGRCRPGGTLFGYPAGGFRRCVVRETPSGPRQVCRFFY